MTGHSNDEWVLETQDIDHYSSFFESGSLEEVVQSVRISAAVKIRVLCTVTSGQQITDFLLYCDMEGIL